MNTLYINRFLLVAGVAALPLVACTVTSPPEEREPLNNARNARSPMPESADRGRTGPSKPTVAEQRVLMTAQRPAVSDKQNKVERADYSGAQTPPGAMRLRELEAIRPPSEPLDREGYAHYDDNPIKRVAEHPVSTFSIDVDTGAYANVRRFLKSGRMPVRDAVRTEELINYFSYDYPAPRDKERPFHAVTEIAPAPWHAERRLLHIGIKGYDVQKAELPPANLVFLIDVSGSMRAPNKLDLLKASLKLLARQLRPEDRISIVVYAGASGVVLEPTAGDKTAKMILALEGLTAGGSTNGGAGIQLAYALASQAFLDGGINRVILATDGDFNVGTVNFEALKDLIADKRRTGISLTTLGFGTGNYNDHLLEQLADAGNGNYAYIDNLHEAQKALVDEISSTMFTIAKDVKIQIEFNPSVVAEYRLIGYENRMLKREDFNNDKVDAGEIGAGHTVTVLYEIALWGSQGRHLEPLRYGVKGDDVNTRVNELAFLRIRYKLPASEQSALMEWPLIKSDVLSDIASASEDFRFSAAVAAFGQTLRGGKYTGAFGYDDITRLARSGSDPFGYRGEFVQLVNLAKSLAAQNQQARR